MLRVTEIDRWIAHALVAMIVALASPSIAAPPGDRVVLADPDPELLRAVVGALAPWRLEVIAEAAPPADDAEAEARGAARGARFIVWRRNHVLIVRDRERRVTDERDGAPGPLDPVAAAAAALTVKTLMRLPPPPVDERPAGEPPVEPNAPRGPGLRVQAIAGGRIARGSETAAGLRAGAAVLVRPWIARGWRAGAAIELGSGADVRRAGFEGTARDWAAIGLVSWSHRRGRWELEPHAGAGVARASLEGTEPPSTPRRELATLAVVRAGFAARIRLGRWTAGATADIDWFGGTPTYTRSSAAAQIYEVPSMALGVGLLAAVDLGDR